jgi:hypothetical protein
MITQEQTELLTTVMSAEEKAGAEHIHCEIGAFARSALDLWRRDEENQRYIDPVAAFVSARRQALAIVATIPAQSLALLRCSEGVDPIAIAKRWNLIGQARRRA